MKKDLYQLIIVLGIGGLAVFIMQFSLDIGIVVLGISAYFTVFVFKWDSVYARAWGIIVFIMALFILISWIWTYILQPLIAWL